MLSFLRYYARLAKTFRRHQPKRVRTLRPTLECLEDRYVPSTIMVTNANDHGANSLRDAIIESNAHPGTSGPNVIDFSLGASSNDEILLNSALPAITSPVVINGNSNTGGAMVDIFANFLNNENGLTINANGCTIKGVGIGTWGANGIQINSSNNVIEGDNIGAVGAAGDANGNGIFINGGDGNTIGGITGAAANVIAQNDGTGIVIDNGQENKIEGNFIGCTANNHGLYNSLDGVEIEGAASENNIVGGYVTGAGNVISGNGTNGVALIKDATGNTVVGNFIGTNQGGEAVGPQMGNYGDGIFIGSGANENFIGVATSPAETIEGKSPPVGNVISGNGRYGVEITGVGTELNFLIANQIGTDKAGGIALGNQLGGVLIHGSATLNSVGPLSSGADNLISGNLAAGVIISGAGTTGNFVINNHIGTKLNGTTALPNKSYGVFIEAGATGNTIGAPGDGNVISGNTYHSGVYIADVGTTGNMVEGNLIGVNATDSGKLGNLVGVTIGAGATGNTIGGTMAGAGNVISGNKDEGVVIADKGTKGNMIEGNEIGTDLTGMVALGNGFSGVAIDNGASGNTVGGANVADRNILSANGDDGVDIAGANDNTVAENYIGVNSLGTGALGNGANGVVIRAGAKGNTVGDGNVISGNKFDGVRLEGAGTTGNFVNNNYIGLNSSGNGALTNGEDGVHLDDGASANSVNYNIISGNTYAGVYMYGASTEDNALHGNVIGIEADMVTPLPNSYGVFIEDGSNENVIGGPGLGNTIADNTHAGIAITGKASVGNTISQNSIYGNGGLGIDLGNTGVPTSPNGGTQVGPNDLQIYPVLTGITVNGASDILSGTLTSTPNSSFTVEIFSSPSGDQGKNYLGSVPVSTNNAGIGTFMFTFTPDAANPILTATATNVNSGDTSEFSAPLTVTGASTNGGFGLTPTSNFTFSLGNAVFSVSITPIGMPGTSYEVILAIEEPNGNWLTIDSTGVDAQEISTAKMFV